MKLCTIVGTGPSLLALKPEIFSETIFALNDAILRIRELELEGHTIYFTQKEGVQGEPKEPEIVILSEYSNAGWEDYPHREIWTTEKLGIPSICISATYAVAVAAAKGFDGAFMQAFDSHFGDVRRIVNGDIDREQRREYISHDAEVAAYAKSIGFGLNWVGQYMAGPPGIGHRVLNTEQVNNEGVGHRSLVPH